MVTGVLVFNALLIGLAICVATQAIPTRIFHGMLAALHGSIGISTPPETGTETRRMRNVRLAVIIWIASALIIVDGMLYLMTYVF